jgi:hypothetical protein
MDTYEGSQGDTLSLHKYLYCSGNPVNGSDPSGHETLIGVSLASTMSMQLESLYNSSVLTLGNALKATIFGVQARKTGEAIYGQFLFEEGVGLALEWAMGRAIEGVGNVWRSGKIEFHIGGGAIFNKLWSATRASGDVFNDIGRGDVCAAAVAAVLRTMKTGERAVVSSIEAATGISFRAGSNPLGSSSAAKKYIESALKDVGVKLQNMGGVFRSVNRDGTYVIVFGNFGEGTAGGHVVIGAMENGRRVVYDPLVGMTRDYLDLVRDWGGELQFFKVTGM